MATKKASIALSVNAIQPTKVIDALSTAAKRLGEDLVREVEYLEKLEVKFGRNNAQYKAQKANVESLEKTIKSFNSATAVEIESAKSLSEVLADLSNTKLRDLKSALGSAKRGLAGLTGTPEDLQRAEQIRQQMKAIGDQVRLLEGQYVNMAETISNINTVSSNTLSKAIKQQQEVVNALHTTDAAYKNELNILKQLEAEEARRAAAAKAPNRFAIEGRAINAYNQVLGNKENMSRQQLEESKKAMLDYQNILRISSPEWEKYGRAIAEAEERLKLFTAQQRMSSKEAMSASLTGKDAWGQKLNSNQIREAQSVLSTERSMARTPQQVQMYSEAIERLEKQYQQLNSTMQNTGKIGGSVMDKVRQTLRAPGRASGKDLTDTIKILQNRLKGLDPASKAFDRLQKKIKDLQQIVSGARLSQEQFNKVIANPKKASIDDLKKAYAMLQQQLNTMRRDGSQAYTTLERNARRLKEEIDSTTVSVQKQNSWFRNAIRNIGAYMGVFAAFNMIKQKITDVITLNMKFSDQLVDIRKVSNMAIQDVNTLARQLAKIDTRSSVQPMPVLNSVWVSMVWQVLKDL